jgi:hypothetical protein
MVVEKEYTEMRTDCNGFIVGSIPPPTVANEKSFGYLIQSWNVHIMITGSEGVSRIVSTSENNTQRSKFSTTTMTEGDHLVPWLSAEGPLSYSPECPPKREDYYFQYSWVIPGVMNPDLNLRRHYYFGAQYRDHARKLFDFWRNTRAKNVSCAVQCHGKVAEDMVEAPVAVYHSPPMLRGPQFLFIQHGSYQIVPCMEQPILDSGEVFIYRGINKERTYRSLQIDAGNLSGHKADIWKRYLATQSFILSDSVRSFNSIHDRAKRCETYHIRDSSWISDDFARDNGLDIKNDNDAAELWKATHQSFSLVRWVAEHKFGPNYIVGRTPLNNIRLTTFFANEHEVRIIRPDRVVLHEAVGCDIQQEQW